MERRITEIPASEWEDVNVDLTPHLPPGPLPPRRGRAALP